MGRCLLNFSHLAIWLLFSLFPGPTFAADVERASRIKAAIIYNIAKFVEWPPEKAAGETITICLDGSSSLNAYIVELLDNRSVANRKFSVKLLNDQPRAAENECEVIFVPLDHNRDLEAKRFAHEHPNVLTICETPSLEWETCVIQLFELDNKAKLAVDLVWAAKIGLRISSELLDLAIVRRNPRDE